MPMECNKWMTGSIIAGHLMVIGVILLLIGAQTPTYTNQLLQAGVKAGLQRNRAEMGEKNWAEWLVSEPNYDVYIFNVTNAANVIANGDKPVLQQIKFSLIERLEKLDISVVGDEAQYLDYATWRPADDTVNLDTKIVTINPVYLTAASGPPAGSEAALYIGIGQTVAGQIKTGFTDPQGLLLSAFRVLSLDSYFLLAGLFSGLGPDSGNLTLQWNGKQYPGFGGAAISQIPPQMNPHAPKFGGFELSEPISPAVAAFLLNKQTPFSLKNSSGLKVWLGAISQPCTADCNTAIGFIKATFVGLNGGSTSAGEHDYDVVRGWLLRLTQLPSVIGGFSDTAYFQMLTFGLGLQGTISAQDLADAKGWSDLGALQWGSGKLTAPLGASSVTMLGLPVPFTSAPEISAWNSNISFGVNASKAALAILADPTLSMTWFGTVATQDPVAIGTLLADPRFAPLMIGKTNTNWIPLFSAYGSVYLPMDFVIKPLILGGPLNEKGVAPNNGGLFMERTVREILWGYRDPFFALKPGSYDGLLGANETAAQFRASGYGWNGINLGTKDLSKNGQVTQWRSLTKLTLRSDIGLPCPAAGDCRVWLEAEEMAGQQGSIYYEPFTQDKNPAPEIKLWAPEIYRTVTLAYTRDVKIKGVTMRRYVIKNEQLMNSTVNPRNANYRMNGPSYIAPMGVIANDAPVYLSFPRQMLADDAIRGNVQGETPADWETTERELLETFLDVEPITGVVMNGAQRLQYNVGINRAVFAGSPLYSKVAANAANGMLYFPLAWVDKHQQLTDQDAKDFKDKIQSQLDMAEKLTIVGEVLGPILIVAGGISIALICNRGRKEMGLS